MKGGNCKMVTTQELDEFTETEYLKVSEVQENDLLKILSTGTFVESFGKKKFQLSVEWNGKKKLLNLNPVQVSQLRKMNWVPGITVSVKKRAFNGGETLDFVPILENVP